MDELELKRIFGRSLRKLRTKKDKTQSQLAEETGISEEYLSKIERGLASPSFMVISKLTDALGVRPSELFRQHNGEMGEEHIMGAHLAEAEDLLQEVFASLPLGLYVSTADGRFILASPSFAAMLGYDSPKALLARVRDIRQHLYAEPEERDELLSCVPADGRLRSAKLAFRRADGERLVVTTHVRRLTGREGEPAVYVGIVEDESTSRLVFPSAGEHDRLALAMREFHHRMQNSFTFLHNYLEVEQLKAEDAPHAEILGAIKARVYAMARLHRRLVSPGLGRMRVRDYLREVLDTAGSSLPPHKSLDLNLNIADIELDWHQVLPVGMIALELVTNSVKHGYPEGGKAEVSVSLANFGERHVLAVCDNGKGLPQDLDVRRPKSFGLSLVTSLTNQLKGDLKVEHGQGASFSIAFPAS